MGYLFVLESVSSYHCFPTSFDAALESQVTFAVAGGQVVAVLSPRLACLNSSVGYNISSCPKKQ